MRCLTNYPGMPSSAAAEECMRIRMYVIVIPLRSIISDEADENSTTTSGIRAAQLGSRRSAVGEEKKQLNRTIITIPGGGYRNCRGPQGKERELNSTQEASSRLISVICSCSAHKDPYIDYKLQHRGRGRLIWFVSTSTREITYVVIVVVVVVPSKRAHHHHHYLFGSVAQPPPWARM